MNPDFMNDLKKHGYCAMIFYKGTACPMVFYSENVVKQITENANEMIKLGLKHGVRLPEQINDYIEQLNIMENMLFQADKKKACPLNEYELTMYWLNVLALTKLKVIANDDMNGLSIMQL